MRMRLGSVELRFARPGAKVSTEVGLRLAGPRHGMIGRVRF